MRTRPARRPRATRVCPCAGVGCPGSRRVSRNPIPNALIQAAPQRRSDADDRRRRDDRADDVAHSR
jgi:hypothetical protein